MRQTTLVRYLRDIVTVVYCEVNRLGQKNWKSGLEWKVSTDLICCAPNFLYREGNTPGLGVNIRQTLARKLLEISQGDYLQNLLMCTEKRTSVTCKMFRESFNESE